MAELSPPLAKVLEAVERGEITAAPGPAWWRGTKWPGRRSPGHALDALRRRLLVEAGQAGEDGRRRVVLTDDGKQELEEVRRGRVDA